MLQRWRIMLQRWRIMLQVAGHYASSGGGIMLQVVDANAGGRALCFRGGALCLKWWMRMET